MKVLLERLITMAAFACAACGVMAAAASADALSGTNAQGAQPLIPYTGPQQTSTTASPSPLVKASAFNTWSDCQNTGYHLCLWHDVGYSGAEWKYDIWHYSQNNYHFVGSAENDQASSAYNHRVNATLLAKDWPPSYPDITCFAPGDAVQYFNQWDWPDGTTPLNDSVSSFDMLSVSTCS